MENKEELKKAKELYDIAVGIEERIKQKQESLKTRRFIFSSNISICFAMLVLILLTYSGIIREFFWSTGLNGTYAREYFLWIMLLALGMWLVFLYGFNKRNLLLFFAGGLVFGGIEVICVEWYFLSLPFVTDVIWHYGYGHLTLTPVPLWLYPAWGIVVVTIRRIDFSVLRKPIKSVCERIQIYENPENKRITIKDHNTESIISVDPDVWESVVKIKDVE